MKEKAFLLNPLTWILTTVLLIGTSILVSICWPSTISFIKDWTQIYAAILFGTSSSIFVAMNYKETKRKNLAGEWQQKKSIWENICSFCEGVTSAGETGREAENKFYTAFHEARLFFRIDDPVSIYLHEMLLKVQKLREIRVLMDQGQLSKEQRAAYSREKGELITWFVKQIAGERMGRVGEKPEARPLDEVFRPHMGLD